ncbi:MAG TPA: SCO family protein [Steroidobacteraceae bacterium]|nr:SCO family protein [Steroidobacteraceae bacterium]
MRVRASNWVPFATAALFTAMAVVTSVAAPKPLPPFERVMNIEPRVVADLEMTDQNGKARRLSDLTGAPAFVFFGFTHCPDACPTTLQKLAMIKSSEVETLKGMRVVLISVDGERDTPAVLKGFLARFSGEFVGLTASPEQVRNLALSFSAPFFKDPPKDGAYAVQHSTRVYALDRQGRLRAELYDASREATIGLARALLAE